MNSYQLVDWDQKRPTSSALCAAWESIRPRPLDRPRSAGLKKYLSAWSSVLKNGRVAFAQFEIPVDPTLGWFVSRNRFAECGFVNNLVKRLGLQKSAPEFLRKPGRVRDLYEIDPLVLDGVLAGRLVWGGAYASFRNRERVAKRIGVEASRALIRDQYSSECTWIVESTEKWSGWFLGIAWDSTLFVFDKTSSILSILAGTDTD